jgi:hypothetical protein
MSTNPQDHDGHRVTFQPEFVVIKEGKSGNTEPDWSLAPKVGDEIDDGTVRWRRVTPSLFCVDCAVEIDLTLTHSREVRQ